MKLCAVIVFILAGCGAAVSQTAPFFAGPAPGYCQAFGPRTGPFWTPTQYLTVCNDGTRLVYLPIGAQSNVIEQLAGPLGSVAQKATLAVGIP